MAIAKTMDGPLSTYWTSQWSEGVEIATKRVWQEGLLSKGGGLCHGIAGNAWPWLVMYYNMTVSNCVQEQTDKRLVSSPCIYA